MLKSFQINNFNSINDPIIFSMEAVQELTEHENFIANLDNENKILKVASIYGPNASGKSNVLYAFQFVKDLISGTLSRENPISGFRNIYKNRNSDFLYFPHEFTKKKNKRTDVSLLFSRTGMEYWYSITAEYLDDETPLLKITNESFSVKKTGESDFNNVFLRKDNEIDADKILRIIGASKLPISNDMSLLRHLNVNYVNVDGYNDLSESEGQNLKHVSDLYDEIQSFLFLNFKEITPVRELRFNGDIINKHKKYIIESLQRLDINISDINAIKGNERNFQVFCTHKVDDVMYKLKLEQESQGTTLLIFLLLMIVSKKDKPTIFLIDELDSHLHPKLVSEIISLFNSEQNLYNQLIFNSHDMWNMVPEQLRRDQIWFTYRNDHLATELICLSDIVNYKGERIRKDAKYSKQYMEGKYGAAPFIRKGLDWNAKK